MAIKSILFAVSIFFLSINVNAAIIDHGTYTTVDGLDWLDLTETTNRSYNDISSQFGAGGEFEGWRYANTFDIWLFFNAFGGSGFYFDGFTTGNNGLVNSLLPYWGETLCSFTQPSVEEGCSNFLYEGEFFDQDNGLVDIGIIYDSPTYYQSPTYDYVQLPQEVKDHSFAHAWYGHALVRDSTVVPVPAAVWLFASGFIGLIGVARRKKYND